MGDWAEEIKPWREDEEPPCNDTVAEGQTADQLLDQMGSHKLRLGLNEIRSDITAASIHFMHFVAHFYLKRAALLEEKFDELADQWERETRNLSSTSAIINHPAYKEIIAMGSSVVPLILRRMKKRPSFWFEALHKITGVNPVKPSMYGNIQQMIEIWLKWGTARGYI